MIGGEYETMRPCLPERFSSKFEVDEQTGCWLWKASTTNGYGIYWHNKRLGRAHIFSYEFFIGPVPPGMDLDHVWERGCDNRNCVNPAHLEPVTRSENIRRGYAKQARPLPTHCKQGHELTATNTYTYKGHRRCKECLRRLQREHTKRRAA